jgi:hypothetical protein
MKDVGKDNVGLHARHPRTWGLAGFGGIRLGQHTGLGTWGCDHLR